MRRDGNGHQRPSKGGYFLETELAWGASAPTQAVARCDASVPLPPLREPITGKPRLDVGEILRGKHILLIGTTGFVGKVALSMLLHRYPEVGKVFCLVRPGAGNTADERFFKKVATVEVFDPLRDVHGDGYEAFMRSKIVAIPGDIGRPLCNFTDEQFAEIEAQGGIHVVINSAGLVSFAPSLESALRINAMGAKNVLDLARKLGARLVHVSTCYVAGQREGDVWEDEPIVGYFPRSSAIARDWGDDDELLDRDFDPAAEIADCQKIIDQARERSNDRQHISQFREQGAESLRAAAPRSRRRERSQDRRRPRAQDLDERRAHEARHGARRATGAGRTRTRTRRASASRSSSSDRRCRSTIVRPAVVESSVRYPFPGWNEGFNTTAPLMYLMLKGHRNVPMGEDTALDVIPVDFIAAGMLLATAAVLAGEHEPVYQLGASDVNRITSKRAHRADRRSRSASVYRDKADAARTSCARKIRARLEGMPVTYEHFEKCSAPMFKRIADGLINVIDEKLPKWGAPRLEAFAERARDELQKVSTFTGQINELVELFKPFTTDHDIAFRCDNIRALWARVTPADQDKLLWAPHLDRLARVLARHALPGPPEVDVRQARRGVRREAEVASTRTRSSSSCSRRRSSCTAIAPALRLLRKDEDAEPITYTYGQMGEARVAGRGRAAPARHRRRATA